MSVTLVKTLTADQFRALHERYTDKELDDLVHNESPVRLVAGHLYYRPERHQVTVDLRYRYYVAVYEVSRCYGGPEEGGWYFDSWTPLPSDDGIGWLYTYDEDLADLICRTLNESGLGRSTGWPTYSRRVAKVSKGLPTDGDDWMPWS